MARGYADRDRPVEVRRIILDCVGHPHPDAVGSPIGSGPARDGSYAISQPWLFGVDADERFVFRGPEHVELEGRAGLRAIAVPLMVVDTPGDVRSLIDLSGGWAYEPATTGALPIAGQAPMSVPPALAVHADGYVWARPDRYEVVQLDRAGQATRVVSVREPLQRMTVSLRQSYLESSGWRTWYPVADEIPFPRTLPAFDRIFVSSSGAIWARLFSWGGNPEEWVCLTDTPVAISRVRFPSRVRVETATADAAYGVWRDELDVEHIVRFHLTRETSRH